MHAVPGWFHDRHTGLFRCHQLHGVRSGAVQQCFHTRMCRMQRRVGYGHVGRERRNRVHHVRGWDLQQHADDRLRNLRGWLGHRHAGQCWQHELHGVRSGTVQLWVNYTVRAVCAGAISVKTRSSQLRRLWSRFRHGAEAKQPGLRFRLGFKFRFVGAGRTSRRCHYLYSLCSGTVQCVLNGAVHTVPFRLG